MNHKLLTSGRRRNIEGRFIATFSDTGTLLVVILHDVVRKLCSVCFSGSTAWSYRCAFQSGLLQTV